MDNPIHRFVADNWSWHTNAPWVLMALVPIAVVLMLVGYVVFQSAN